MERGSGYPARCRSPWGAQVPRAAVGGAPARPAWSGVSGGARRRERGGWLGSAWLGWDGMGWAGLSAAFPTEAPGGQAATARSLPRPIVAPRRRREPPARALPAGADRTCRVHGHSLRSGAPAPPGGSGFPGPSLGAREEGADIPAAAARPVAEAPPGKLKRGRRARGRRGRGGPGAPGRGPMLRDAGRRPVGSVPGSEQLAGPRGSTRAAGERRAPRFAPACGSECSAQRWENCRVLQVNCFTEGTRKRWNHLS